MVFEGLTMRSIRIQREILQPRHCQPWRNTTLFVEIYPEKYIDLQKEELVGNDSW